VQAVEEKGRPGEGGKRRGREGGKQTAGGKEGEGQPKEHDGGGRTIQTKSKDTV